jgi:hypothetical protein
MELRRLNGPGLSLTTEEALRNVSSELMLTREDAIRYIVRE